MPARSTRCGTRSPIPNASRAGSCRSPASCASAGATSSPATPAARSRACDPPRALAVTWEHGGSVSWLTVTLTPAGDATDLELEHVAHVDDAFWDQFGPGAVGVGWDMGADGAGRAPHRGTPEVDPARAAAWGASDEGKAFVHASSESWADASIAAGTPAAAARASAGRTTAFYTGGLTADADARLRRPARSGTAPHPRGAGRRRSARRAASSR